MINYKAFDEQGNLLIETHSEQGFTEYVIGLQPHSISCDTPDCAGPIATLPDDYYWFLTDGTLDCGPIPKDVKLENLGKDYMAIADEREKLKKEFEAKYDELSSKMDDVTRKISETWKN